MIGFIILVCAIFVARGIAQDTTPANPAFDDFNFYKCVVDAYNKENPENHKEYTANLTDSELQSITNLSCSGEAKRDTEKIISTKGLEKLTSLITLYLYNNNINEVNVKNNTKLETLTLSKNNINEIDLKNNLELKVLALSDNNLTTIDLSKNTQLTQ